MLPKNGFAGFYTFFASENFAAVKCRAPRNGRDTQASAPVVTGEVLAVNIEERSLRISVISPDSLKPSVEVHNVDEKRIFTQYGGKAQLGEIIKGDEVRIWSVDCKAREGKVIADAVVVLK